MLLLSDAKHRPEALSSDVGGIRNATSGSATDKLTREHRMTLDEAHLVLNVKRGEAMENILKVSGSRVVGKLDDMANCVTHAELRASVQSKLASTCSGPTSVRFTT